MLPSSCSPSPKSSVPEIPDASHSFHEELRFLCPRPVLSLRLCPRTTLQKGQTATLPITTSSAKARELYLKGMDDYENLYLERCNDDWRAAVKEDPNLAVAWAWIAFNSGNPEEVSPRGKKPRNCPRSCLPANN